MWNKGAETSNVPTTPGSQISSTTSTCYASCIGTYETKVEYDVVSREYQNDRCRESVHA
jgi:hypothetical protein